MGPAWQLHDRRPSGPQQSVRLFASQMRVPAEKGLEEVGGVREVEAAAGKSGVANVVETEAGVVRPVVRRRPLLDAGTQRDGREGENDA